MNPIKGKVAIVTGGGSGIGRGVAIGLAQQGANLVLCGRRKTNIEATASEIHQMGTRALAVVADVSQAEAADRVVQAALEAFQRIDILINNAGIFAGGNIHEHLLADWEQIMAVNLSGPFLMARAVLPTMRAQRDGHIINISSESGIEYYTGEDAYTVSKHALNTLGELIQRENQDFNIRVNTICPGMVWTEMADEREGLDKAKCLYPEDIAELVIWLLSRRQNIKIGTPILIQTMLNPWE